MNRVWTSIALILVLTLIWALPGVFRKNEEAVSDSACKLRLQELRAAVVEFKTQSGAYPAKLGDLVPQFCPEERLYCPLIEHKDEKLKFVYTIPDEAIGADAVVFRTPTAAFKSNDLQLFMVINLRGDIRCSPK